MDRRTRICIWVILIGLANFLAYVIGYILLQGEAIGGYILEVNGQFHYLLHTNREVSRGLYIYSGVHSISIWPTVGAVMLAMLTLAKERIASSMRSAIVRGRTLMTILATIITIFVILMTILFVRDWCHSFSDPSRDRMPQTQAVDVTNAPYGR